MGLYKRRGSECWQMCFYLGGRKVRKSTKTTNKKIAQRIYDRTKWQVAEGKYNTRKGTPIKKASVNRELAFLKTMFNQAVEWGYIDENVATRIKLLRGEEKRLRILSRNEIAKLIQYAADHLKPILITAISTGMRKNEILNLKWKHIDFSNGFILVVNSKNGDARNVPLSQFLKETLAQMMKEENQEEYVFKRKNGERIRCIKEAFSAACSREGIADFRFHDLRHTAASLLAAGGCDIITLQHILGHKTLAITQRYAHLIPGRHEKTKEIMQSLWEGDTLGDTVDFKRNMRLVSN